jgi:hypothetical protein
MAGLKVVMALAWAGGLLGELLRREMSEEVVSESKDGAETLYLRKTAALL